MKLYFVNFLERATTGISFNIEKSAKNLAGIFSKNFYVSLLQLIFWKQKSPTVKKIKEEKNIMYS